VSGRDGTGKKATGKNSTLSLLEMGTLFFGFEFGVWENVTLVCH